VRDAGAGFDAEAAKLNGGLGFVSMQERVHLVHGRFSVESKCGEGTRIVVAVPVVAENGRPLADAGGNATASVTGAA
jgi:signal transduction histidine kinase